MAPDPPHHGRTMDINVTGTTPLSTPGGRFQVAVSYLGVRVYTCSHATDLCDAMPCPLEAGTPFRLRVSQKLPMLAPPGPYTMEITGDAEAGGRFMCVRPPPLMGVLAALLCLSALFKVPARGVP
eukprot:XP_001692668.1 predicted protein [Chlamydomonas reinhardtii]